jgi:hypothetical protein
LNFYSSNLSRFQYFDRKGNTHQEKEIRDIESKKIYELKRKRGFIDSWSKDFDGLQDSSDGMICTYCKKFPNTAICNLQ